MIILAITFTVILKIIYNIGIDILILYANGIFVLIYLFVALSGIKLLKNEDKIISIVATCILIGIMFIIGFGMIYSIIVLLGLILLEKIKSNKSEEKNK